MTARSNINFSSLKKSSFQKSMFLLNFRFDDLQNEKLLNNQNNNLMIFKWVLFDDFHLMLLQDHERPI